MKFRPLPVGDGLTVCRFFRVDDDPSHAVGSCVVSLAGVRQDLKRKNADSQDISEVGCVGQHRLVKRVSHCQHALQIGILDLKGFAQEHGFRQFTLPHFEWNT